MWDNRYFGLGSWLVVIRNRYRLFFLNLYSKKKKNWVTILSNPCTKSKSFNRLMKANLTRRQDYHMQTFKIDQFHFQHWIVNCWNRHLNMMLLCNPWAIALAHLNYYFRYLTPSLLFHLSWYSWDCSCDGSEVWMSFLVDLNDLNDHTHLK